MTKEIEANPSGKLYLMDEVQLQCLKQVAEGLGTLLDQHKVHPALMMPEAADLLTVARAMINKALENVPVHHAAR
jgi:hypothetical protein